MFAENLEACITDYESRSFMRHKLELEGNG